MILFKEGHAWVGVWLHADPPLWDWLPGAALVLGLMTLAARVSGAMKGPLPPALLAPVPTPVGDLGAAARLAWALDGLLLTAAAGASVTLIAASPFPALIVGVTIGGLVLWRWRHRR